MVDLVVIGGGITGLAAAWEARARGADVVVLEGAESPGGKLRTSPVAGIPIDEGADTFLVRRPEAVTLCRELGLEDELVAPATGQAYLWVDDRLRPLPREQLLGIPTDLDAVAASGILSTEGLARAAADLAVEGREGEDGTDESGSSADVRVDEAVGALIRRRLGDEVHERLVAPLLGGIWAGDSDNLSTLVAAPAIAEARDRDRSLIRGARALRAAAVTPPDAPVFLAPRRGMGRLVEALLEELGEDIRSGQPVKAVVPEREDGRPSGLRVEPAGLRADRVLVATPAPIAADLVGPSSPRAAAGLAEIECASVALVTLAVPREGIDHPLDGSGFLVPPSAGLLLTACSWASTKWAHLAGDGSTVLLRASAGRDRDDRALRLNDDDLVEAVLDDLGRTMGLRRPPVDVRVNRWHRALPQPRPGHLERVSAIEAALAEDVPGLAVAGAWARGVGIPACIGSGRSAAAALLAHTL